MKKGVEWLKARREYIGSSDAPALIGANPYKTIYALYQEKISEDEPDPSPPSQAAKMGNLLEPIIAQLFEEETGLKTIDTDEARVYESPVNPAFKAEIDRLVLNEKGEDIGILECKSTSGFAWRANKGEAVPPYYYAQVQWQLWVSGYKKGWIAVLIDGRKFEIFEVAEDKPYQKRLEEAAINFWQVVKDKKPPVPDEAEIEDEPGKKSKIIKTILADTFGTVKEEISELKKVEDSLKETFLDFSTVFNAEKIEGNDYEVKISEYDSSSLDQKALGEFLGKHGKTLDDFKAKKTTKRITVKKRG